MAHYVAQLLTTIRLICIPSSVLLLSSLLIIFKNFADEGYDVNDVDDRECDMFKNYVKLIKKLSIALIICIVISVFLPTGNSFLAMIGIE